MLRKEEGRWLLFFYLTAMAQRGAENASIDLFSAPLCALRLKRKKAEGRQAFSHYIRNNKHNT